MNVFSFSLPYFGLCATLFFIFYLFLYIEFLYNILILIFSFAFLFYISNLTASLLWHDIFRKYNLIPIEKINSKSKSILITGCDTGFGNKLVYKLLDYGFIVFACCLNIECEGAKQLKNYEKSNRLFIVKMDVIKQEEVNKAVDFVTNKLNQINSELFALVNNAGIMFSTEIEFGGVDLYESQINVNCIGAIRVTKAFLGLLRRTSLINQNVIKKLKKNTFEKNIEKPRIINVCSLAGRFAIPGINSYCVSKSALICFTSGLRRELLKWNIDVVSIEPHLFKTNLVNAENQNFQLKKALNNTLEEVLKSYGEKYIEGYKKFLDKMLNSARDGVNDVVNTLFISLTDKFVSNTYTVVENNFERIRLLLYNFIPEKFLDLIGHFAMQYITGKPVVYDTKE